MSQFSNAGGVNVNGVPVTTILLNNALTSDNDRTLIERGLTHQNAGPGSFQIIGIDSEPDRIGRAIFGFNYFRVSEEVTNLPRPNNVTTGNQRRCIVINGSTGEVLANLQPGLGSAITENQIIIDAVNSVSIAEPADPFETWAEEQNIPEAQRAFDADPDDDGINNLLEYAYGTNPTVPSQSSAPRLNGDLQFIYQRSKTADVTPFGLMASTTLEPNSFSPFTPDAGSISVTDQGEIEIVTVNLSSGMERIFFILETSRPQE